MRTAAVGDLPSLQTCFKESLALRHWQQPLPLWFLVQIMSVAAPQGHVPMVRWLLAGGCSATTLPPLKRLVHDIVQRAMPSSSGSSAGGSSDGSSGAIDDVSTVVRALVTDGGFDVSFPRSGDGWTPLHACCSRNLVTLARELLQLGADVNAVCLLHLRCCVRLFHKTSSQLTISRVQFVVNCSFCVFSLSLFQTTRS